MAVLRAGVALTILALVVARLGPGPFVDGFAATSWQPLVVATGLTWITTVAAAQRWRLVGRRLGCDLPLRQGVASCYRSQFLNTVLPGGVLGDVHRGVRHGRSSGDLGRGVRSVVWDRTFGQVVQVALTAGALLILPSPWRNARLLVAVLGLAASVSLVVVLLRRRGRSASSARHLVGAFAADWRLLHGRGLAAGVVAASVVVALGHAVVLLAAMTAVGVDLPLNRALPLALLVQLAAAVPLNVGGWGPREGVAAWAFGAAGVGAASGVAATSLYAVLAFVATLPGAALLLVRAAPEPVRLEEEVHLV